jgi:hypothetical protein
MYRRSTPGQLSVENFYLPFGGKLSAENRWVKLAVLILWEKFEAEYGAQLSEEMDAPAKSFRMALGALIIKERLGTSDAETVEQLRENHQIEGKFGQGKRRFSLGRVMAKLAATAECTIAIAGIIRCDRFLYFPGSDCCLAW